MAKQTFTTGQVLTAAQVNSLQTNDFNQTVNAKTASYVLVASDKGTRIEFNTSGSVTCTVNTGIFDAGDTLIVQNRGAGAVTITAGTATVNTGGSLILNQYESGTLYFISASAALWFGTNPGDITGITTGATSGLTGGVTSGTADIKLNTTAKGGLLVGTGSGTVTELTVGSNNTVLTADSTTASGLKWAAAAGGGKVLQVVYGTYNTVTTVTTSGYQDTGLSLAITPSATTSKVLIIANQAVYFSRSSTVQAVGIKLLRGTTGILSTTIQDTSVGVAATGASFVDQRTWCPMVYLDSPSTTSSTTYKVQGSLYQTSGSGTAVYQEGSNVSQITLLEIGA